MFLNYLKDFSTKKIVKKRLSNVKHLTSEGKIKTVGIIFDESYFKEREALVQELIQNGIAENAVIVLVFKDKMSLLIGTQKPEEAQKALTLINFSPIE